MISTSIVSVAAAVIIGLGSIILIWWLTSRLNSNRLRNLLRIVLLPVFVAGVGLFSLILARSQTDLLPETTPILIPVETTTTELGTLRQTLNATGSLAAGSDSSLSFASSGVVTEVLVKAGDYVRAGDVLARVDTTALDSQVRSAELDLRAAQASLVALQAPPTELDIAMAQISIDSATASLSSASQTGSDAVDVEIARLNEELARNSLWQSQLNQAISASGRSGSIVNNGSEYSRDVQNQASLAQSETNVTISQLSYEATVNDGPDQSQLASASAQLMSAQANMDDLLAGASTTELRNAEIDLEMAQMALDSLEQQREDSVLVAPFDGIVAAVNVDVGEMPSVNAFTLIDTSSYTITLSVDEKDISQLEVGQSVSVSISALNNASLTGTVTWIDLAPSSTSGLVTYSVEVTLNPADTPVRPGMTAVANVVLNEVDGVIVVHIAAARPGARSLTG